MVLLKGHLVGLGGVDTDEVGVILIPLPVTDALEEDLDEAEASVAQERQPFRIPHATARCLAHALQPGADPDVPGLRHLLCATGMHTHTAGVNPQLLS